MPSAIGKSKRPDSLGKSAGAKLTVMRLAGNSNLAFCRAALTLSLDSLTSVSGKPTIVKEGKPFARCTSTVTSGASMPDRARLFKTARLIEGLMLIDFVATIADCEAVRQSRVV